MADFLAEHRPTITKPQARAEFRGEREIRALRAENHNLRTRNLILTKEADFTTKFLGFLNNTIEALPPVRPPTIGRRRNTRAEAAAILVGSCWHIGEWVSREQMIGLGEYSFEIFCRKLQFVIDKTIHQCRDNWAAYSVRDLHIFLTGDMVSGTIHELSSSNELNIVEQATIGAYVVAQAIRSLALAFRSITVTCVAGNHGRLTEKKYFKDKQQLSWDFVFYNELALWLREQTNIRFNIPLAPAAIVKVMDHNFLISHGDEVRSVLGIPFYGIKRQAATVVKVHAKMKRLIHYWVLSHFHTSGELQDSLAEPIMNGCLKGGCEYSLHGSFGANEARQKLFLVSPRYGKADTLDLKPDLAHTSHRFVYSRSEAAGTQRLPEATGKPQK